MTQPSKWANSTRTNTPDSGNTNAPAHAGNASTAGNTSNLGEVQILAIAYALEAVLNSTVHTVLRGLCNAEEI
jgi:hypothetical protein